MSNFGDHTIYVALIDSKNESFPAEFGMEYREWIEQVGKQEKV